MPKYQKVVIRLQNSKDCGKFHNVEVLIPNTMLADELFEDGGYPVLVGAEIEPSNFHIVKDD